MNFRKYPSLENSYREKFIGLIQAHPCSQEEWYVTEKVHGANFSFTTDGKTVLSGRRTDFLKSEEEQKQFYKCHNLVAKLSSKILELFETVKKNDENVTRVIVYGELFGGGKTGVPLIQKGVLYPDDHDFYVFDVRVNDDLLPYDDVVSLCEKHGFTYARCLFRGTFPECMKWSSEHNADDSTLSDHKNNVREGNVVRPVKPHTLHTGDAVILKDKNEKFSEKASEPKNKEVKAVETLPVTERLISESEKFVTEQRLNNLISKLGPIQNKSQIAKYSGLLVKDILDDMAKEEPEIMTLEKAQSKKIFSHLQNSCRKLIQEKF